MTDSTSSLKQSYKTKFMGLLSLFLPGIFLLGFNIGTGSVTSMAKALAIEVTLPVPILNPSKKIPGRNNDKSPINLVL